ncbi:MAG: ribose-5-phosphate isomerase RpiA [Pseudomonadota bacterium]|nr:ribose-5-phosphate isomerase RpiA [Pseudomonadota bacterium]
MKETVSSKELGKKNAAAKALDFVSDGMVIGLGTGSTANWFLELLAKKIEERKLEIVGVPTSHKTAVLSKDLGIPLGTLDEFPNLNLVIDGADEFDPNFNLIKGGGGALLQEKIVAAASDHMIVISDYTKRVTVLGEFPLPLEIVKFGAKSTLKRVLGVLSQLNYTDFSFSWRTIEDGLFITDEQHLILDLHLRKIKRVDELEKGLLSCPGVVETGLFSGFAKTIITGERDGTCNILEMNCNDANK